METATHLNLCPSEGQIQLLNDMVTDLRKWLYKHHDHPEVVYWIPNYIQLRGTQKLGDFPHLSLEIKEVAVQQDLIPWKDFMEKAKLQRPSFASKVIHFCALHPSSMLETGPSN